MYLSYIHEPGYDNVTLVISMEQPGNTKIYNINFDLKDDTADCTGDICDQMLVLTDSTSIKAGKYKLSVAHNFAHDIMPNVLAVGVEVKASK